MKYEATGFDQPQVVTRTGEAPEVPSEKAVVLAGTLKAPGDYLVHKVSKDVKITRLEHDEKGYHQVSEQLYFMEQSILHVDSVNKRLVLQLNAKNHTTDNIKGDLTLFSLWEDLKVNTGHNWSIVTLRKFLKKIKYYFADPDQHSEFLAKLQNFVAKVESNYKDISKSGEIDLGQSHKISDGVVIPLFHISAPIYNGYEKKKVAVEIFVDVTDASISFQLESQDLFTLIEELGQEYLEEEISRIVKMCDETPISVVNIN